MSMYKNLLVAGCIMLGLGLAPQLANAEADSDVGSGTLSAAAHLNLQVVIPAFLRFRVGSAGATVDTITFDMKDCVTDGSCTLGDGTAFTDGSGGDAAGGSGANVALSSNAGLITITESNDTGNGLVDGSNSISLDEISVSTDKPGSFDPPTLSDTGGNTSSPALNGGSNVTNQTAVWTYSYDNTTVPDPGTYNVEIIYTAANL